MRGNPKVLSLGWLQLSDHMRELSKKRWKKDGGPPSLNPEAVRSRHYRRVKSHKKVAEAIRRIATAVRMPTREKEQLIVRKLRQLEEEKRHMRSEKIAAEADTFFEPGTHRRDCGLVMSLLGEGPRCLDCTCPRDAKKPDSGTSGAAEVVNLGDDKSPSST